MEEEISPERIKEAVEALHINVPILNTRIVGRRLELSLYGGRVVYHPVMELKIVDEVKPPPAFADIPSNRAILQNPERFNRGDLRAAAAGLGIPKAWSMNKIPLVQAIKAWKKETGWKPPAEPE